MDCWFDISLWHLGNQVLQWKAVWVKCQRHLGMKTFVGRSWILLYRKEVCCWEMAFLTMGERAKFHLILETVQVIPGQSGPELLIFPNPYFWKVCYLFLLCFSCFFSLAFNVSWKWSESESLSVISDSLRPHGQYSPGNSPSQNTGVGSLSPLQGIFPTQGSNLGLSHCRQIFYQLSHKGSPRILEWVAYAFYSGSSQPRNQNKVSCIARRFFTNWAMRESLMFPETTLKKLPKVLIIYTMITIMIVDHLLYDRQCIKDYIVISLNSHRHMWGRYTWYPQITDWRGKKRVWRG